MFTIEIEDGREAPIKPSKRKKVELIRLKFCMATHMTLREDI